MLFVHTTKAIRKGNPADRVFVVAKNPDGSFIEDDGYYLAWKTEIKNNCFWHPAFGDIMTEEEVRTLDLSSPNSNNGSGPTAWVKHDSFYKKITLNNVIINCFGHR